MKLKSVTIKNFRGIGKLEAPIDFSDFSIFIGDNGTGKTAILEAVNFCLSPGFVESRLDVNEFYGGENEIEITVEFAEFTAKLPDGLQPKMSSAIE